MDCQELNEVLSTLIVETRKENGEKYPPHTLYQLHSGLHRYASLLHLDVDLLQFCSSKLTFHRCHRTLGMSTNISLGQFVQWASDYTLLGCFIHDKITV